MLLYFGAEITPLYVIELKRTHCYQLLAVSQKLNCNNLGPLNYPQQKKITEGFIHTLSNHFEVTVILPLIYKITNNTRHLISYFSRLSADKPEYTVLYKTCF